jgi:hypothetical protein
MIFLTADLHLSELIWQDRKRIAGDSYRAWDRLVADVLVERGKGGPVAVVIAGDIFDMARPDAYTEYVFAAGCVRMKRAGVELYAVQGNHDYSEYPRYCLFGVGALSAKPVLLQGLRFCGVDAQAAAGKLQERLAAVPECDWLVLHAPFRHLLGFEGRWQAEGADIPDHVGSVLVGDIHVKSAAVFGGHAVYSPGATHPRSAGEFGRDHGCWVLDGDKVDYRTVSGRDFTTCTVQSEQDLATLAAAYGKVSAAADDAARPVVNLVYPLAMAAQVLDVQAALGDRVFVLLDPFTVDSAGIEVKLGDVSGDMPSLLDVLPDAVDAEKEPVLAGLVGNMLRTPDCAAAQLEQYAAAQGARLMQQ